MAAAIACSAWGGALLGFTHEKLLLLADYLLNIVLHFNE
jgi:hypothetical protein